MGKGKAFNVGDMVFAKVRGYPHWPARIISVADPKPANLKYHVYFFGTAETASVLAKDIVLYAENKEKYSKAVKRKMFKEGLDQIEEEIKKIENGEESTLGMVPPSAPEITSTAENVEPVPKKVRKSKAKADDAQNDTSPPAEDNQVSAKPKKRKRESTEPDADEVPKKRRMTSRDKGEDNVEGSVTKSEQISRSGRVIKPKKFLYDEGEDPDGKVKTKAATTPAPITSPSQEMKKEKDKNKDKDQDKEKENIMKKPKDVTSKSPVRNTPRNRDMGRIMWAKTKCGQMVQIKLDYDRPAKFKDDRARMMWERATDINAKRLKAEIESMEIGDITREDIKLQLRPTEEQKEKLTEEQYNNMKKKRIIERKRGKLRWLKLETRLVDIDVLIKTSLQKAKVDIDKALTLMDELINMPLDPLMLKKHPQVVDTTKKLRQYVGNISEWNLTPEEKTSFEAKAYKVRQKANALFNKYTALFAVPENSNFWSVFIESLNEFAQLTEDMPRERVYGLIVDPTSPYFKDVIQEEKEEEEFKLKLKEDKEESPEKKLNSSDEKMEEIKADESSEK